MYGTDPALSKWGGLAVGVPGELRGLAEMHKRWGRLSWKRVVSPSAKLAMGWTVSKELAGRLERLGQFILNDPDWKPIFAPRGVFLKEGEHISRLSYGETLRSVAEHGAEVFYKVHSPVGPSIPCADVFRTTFVVIGSHCGFLHRQSTSEGWYSHSGRC